MKTKPHTDLIAGEGIGVAAVAVEERTVAVLVRILLCDGDPARSRQMNASARIPPPINQRTSRGLEQKE